MTSAQESRMTAVSKVFVWRHDWLENLDRDTERYMPCDRTTMCFRDYHYNNYNYGTKIITTKMMG